MTEATRAVRWIFERESRAQPAGPSDSGVALSTLRRVHDRIRDHLSPSIGSAGFLALFTRGMTVHARVEPMLVELARAPGPEQFDRLCRVLADQDSVRVAEVGLALLCTLCEQLATFIGPGVVLQLLRNAWPELPPAGSLPGGKS